MKHLLLALYIFSVLYCYLQVFGVIERCISLFKERHPTVCINDTKWYGFKLTLEVLAISSIPVVNLFLGVFCKTSGDVVIDEVVSEVEMKHWNEIKDAESKIKREDLDEYF